MGLKPTMAGEAEFLLTTNLEFCTPTFWKVAILLQLSKSYCTQTYSFLTPTFCQFSINLYSSNSQLLLEGGCFIPTSKILVRTLRGLRSLIVSWESFEPRHDKTNKMAVCPVKTQTSLIRVFAIRMKKAWVLSYPLSAQLRLI